MDVPQVKLEIGPFLSGAGHVTVMIFLSLNGFGEKRGFRLEIGAYPKASPKLGPEPEVETLVAPLQGAIVHSVHIQVVP